MGMVYNEEEKNESIQEVKRKDSWLEHQRCMLNIIQDEGFSLVKCITCGKVFIIDLESEEDITCYCGFTARACEFPEYF